MNLAQEALAQEMSTYQQVVEGQDWSRAGSWAIVILLVALAVIRIVILGRKNLGPGTSLVSALKRKLGF